MQSIILEAAERAVEAGISVVPIRADGSKAPAVAWSPYQERLALPVELKAWFPPDAPKGLAVIGGSVSGGLEVLDFDDLSAFSEWVQLCKDHDLAGIAGRLPIAITPGDGRHLYYRHLGEQQGNQKLARAASQQVRIETRGEGGYAIVPPSPAACHPSGLSYKWLKGSLESLPILTADERVALLTMARILNEWVEPERVRGLSTSGRAVDGTRPGDDYNARGDVQALLEGHGWRFHRRDRLGELWTRPGKQEGNSARLFSESRLFCPFSSNAQPFQADASYSPFAVYAELECAGDYQEAARRLGADGYGEPPHKPGIAHPGLSGREQEKRPLHCFPNTDYGNAERLVELEGEDVRYCYEWGTWLCWDHARWLKDKTGDINRRAKGVVREMYRVAAQIEDDDRRKAFSKWARDAEARARMEAMIYMAQSEPSVPVLIEALDQDPLLLCCTNGTLDLQSGELRAHSRGDLMTKMVPVAYDKEALCPLWDAFLERILPDAGVRDFLQRSVGYSLTGSVSAQCLFFLYGKGANGKSTFINALLALMGDYAMQAAPDILMSSDKQRNGPCPEIAGLVGARFVATSEVDEGRRLAEGLVKQITGGEPIRARFLHQDYFEFQPTHKLWFSANHKPVIRGGDEGIWRRIKLVPFDVTIPAEERDPDLNSKLTAELPGILAWAVRGCLAWGVDKSKNGLAEPAAIRAATANYRSEMDALAAFLEDCCVVEADGVDKSGFKIAGSELYNAYAQWSEINGDKPLGKKSFGSRLQERNKIEPAINIGPKHARGWTGIRLKTDEEKTNGPEKPYSSKLDFQYEQHGNENHLSIDPNDEALWEAL